MALRTFNACHLQLTTIASFQIRIGLANENFLAGVEVDSAG
jgi:hypothetical protein